MGGVGGARGGGRAVSLFFHHQGSTFLQWAYGSNDLPRPRRSVLSVLLVYFFKEVLYCHF